MSWGDTQKEEFFLFIYLKLCFWEKTLRPITALETEKSPSFAQLIITSFVLKLSHCHFWHTISYGRQSTTLPQSSGCTFYSISRVHPCAKNSYCSVCWFCCYLEVFITFSSVNTSVELQFSAKTSGFLHPTPQKLCESWPKSILPVCTEMRLDSVFLALEDPQPGTSMVVQWLRIRLPIQGTWVWSLVAELRYCRITTATGESLDAAAESPVHSEEDPAQPIFFFLSSQPVPERMRLSSHCISLIR